MGYVKDYCSICGWSGCGIDDLTEGIGTVLCKECRIRGEAGCEEDSWVLGVS